MTEICKTKKLRPGPYSIRSTSTQQAQSQIPFYSHIKTLSRTTNTFLTLYTTTHFYINTLLNNFCIFINAVQMHKFLTFPSIVWHPNFSQKIFSYEKRENGVKKPIKKRNGKKVSSIQDRINLGPTKITFNLFNAHFDLICKSIFVFCICVR